MIESGQVRALILTGFLLVPIFASALHNSLKEASSSDTSTFQKGMSYATYANMTPNAFGSVESHDSLRRIKQIGVEWVAINVVGWYQANKYSADIHRNPKQAPTDEDLADAIQSAKNLGMKVMLKPMIDLEDGAWRGEIQPTRKWFENYTSYINSFAEFAERYRVEMFCIGTELTATVSWESEWRNTISSVRHRFSGPITYAAIWWKEYDDLVTWWDALDYVGIDAYFPLSSKNDPTIGEMKTTWEKITSFLESFYEEVKKPMIFTEIGFLSTDGTNKDPSNYRLQEIPGRLIDLQEQADCYEATFQALWNRTWLYGFYWWYWQPDPDAGGPNNSDYTPQNKPAQGVLIHWYSLDWDSGVCYPEDYTPYLVNGVILVAVIEAAMLVFLWKRRKSVPKG